MERIIDEKEEARVKYVRMMRKKHKLFRVSTLNHYLDAGTAAQLLSWINHRKGILASRKQTIAKLRKKRDGMKKKKKNKGKGYQKLKKQIEKEVKHRDECDLSLKKLVRLRELVVEIEKLRADEMAAEKKEREEEMELEKAQIDEEKRQHDTTLAEEARQEELRLAEERRQAEAQLEEERRRNQAELAEERRRNDAELAEERYQHELEIDLELQQEAAMENRRLAAEERRLELIGQILAMEGASAQQKERMIMAVQTPQGEEEEADEDDENPDDEY